MASNPDLATLAAALKAFAETCGAKVGPRGEGQWGRAPCGKPATYAAEDYDHTEWRCHEHRNFINNVYGDGVPTSGGWEYAQLDNRQVALWAALDAWGAK